jgi:hypothetical protein
MMLDNALTELFDAGDELALDLSKSRALVAPRATEFRLHNGSHKADAVPTTISIACAKSTVTIAGWSSVLIFARGSEHALWPRFRRPEVPVQGSMARAPGYRGLRLP